MKTRVLLISGLLALILAIGATAVFAQEPDTADPEPGPTVETLPPLPDIDGQHGFRGRLEGITPREELLAEALDISVEELQAARYEAQNAWLAEMVEAGYLTQEQADLMVAAQSLRRFIDREALLAEALGIDTADLSAAREAGTTIPEHINELGLTPAEVFAAEQAAYQAAVEEAVAQGVLTQEQADQLATYAPGPGPGRGFGGHHGRGRSGFGGFDGLTPAVPSGVAFSATGVAF